VASLSQQSPTRRLSLNRRSRCSKQRPDSFAQSTMGLAARVGCVVQSIVQPCTLLKWARQAKCAGNAPAAPRRKGGSRRTPDEVRALIDLNHLMFFDLNAAKRHEAVAVERMAMHWLSHLVTASHPR